MHSSQPSEATHSNNFTHIPSPIRIAGYSSTPPNFQLRCTLQFRPFGHATGLHATTVGGQSMNIDDDSPATNSPSTTHTDAAQQDVANSRSDAAGIAEIPAAAAAASPTRTSAGGSIEPSTPTSTQRNLQNVAQAECPTAASIQTRHGAVGKRTVSDSAIIGTVSPAAQSPRKIGGGHGDDDDTPAGDVFVGRSTPSPLSASGRRSRLRTTYDRTGTCREWFSGSGGGGGSDGSTSSLSYGSYSAVRRVSFPENDAELVTGYLEPANPWATGACCATG